MFEVLVQIRATPTIRLHIWNVRGSSTNTCYSHHYTTYLLIYCKDLYNEVVGAASADFIDWRWGRKIIIWTIILVPHAPCAVAAYGLAGSLPYQRGTTGVLGPQVWNHWFVVWAVLKHRQSSSATPSLITWRNCLSIIFSLSILVYGSYFLLPWASVNPLKSCNSCVYHNINP